MIILENDADNIFKINSDGTGKTYLTDDEPGTVNNLAAWSPDDTKIVYSRQGPNEPSNIWHISIMNADGSGKQQLTSGTLTGTLAVFSPNGKQILFDGPGDGTTDIAELWLMNADGTDPHPITSTSGSQISRTGLFLQWSSNGSFSPDGSKIVCASSQSGRTEIWVMNADGSNQTQLTFPDDANAPDANDPSWSPDGSKIVFWSGFVREYGNIFTMNPDGSDRTQLTFDPAPINTDNPVWSPDGQSIMFESGRNGTLATYIMNADGSDQQLLFSGSYGGGRMPLASADQAPCFCRGTLILTDRGEVPVENLAVGDRVVTLSGVCRPIAWIGFGRDLVTRANRLARPIVVRRAALADNVPCRDLYLTHGHALFFDGVLIPVEHLVNHRSIAWDGTARVVDYYHIELDDHDVLFAEGAPTESYHDAGNRAFFQNAREGHEPGAAKPTFAPLLHSGDIVETVWAALFERAGGHVETNTTHDADLHLVVDGERLEPTAIDDCAYSFAVERPPTDTLRLRSRSGVPSLLGLSRHDHRPLGVAIRQVILQHAGIPTCFDFDAPQFREGGCHLPEDGYCWTDGEFELPARFVTLLNGAFRLVVHTQPHYDMRYPIAAAPAVAA